MMFSNGFRHILLSFGVNRYRMMIYLKGQVHARGHNLIGLSLMAITFVSFKVTN